MAHDASCSCAYCREVRRTALAIEQPDRDALADAWAKWVSDSDGEAVKLRSGEDGNPGSPRWTALQAIAAARRRAVTLVSIGAHA